MYFIFHDQINVIFMRPLYKAVILCDCIINANNILQKSSSVSSLQQKYTELENDYQTTMRNSELHKNKVIEVNPIVIIYWCLLTS